MRRASMREQGTEGWTAQRGKASLGKPASPRGGASDPQARCDWLKLPGGQPIRGCEPEGSLRGSWRASYLLPAAWQGNQRTGRQGLAISCGSQSGGGQSIRGLSLGLARTLSVADRRHEDGQPINAAHSDSDLETGALGQFGFSVLVSQFWPHCGSWPNPRPWQ